MMYLEKIGKDSLLVEVGKPTVTTQIKISSFENIQHWYATEL